MRFNKIALLLIASVVTTLSSAAAIDPNVHNIYVRVDEGCVGTYSKRNLESRAPPSGYVDVPMSGFNEMKWPLGLYTEGLVTCIGAAVTFQASDGTSWRFLAHLVGSPGTLGAKFNDFEEAIVKQVEKSGAITNLQCVISPPNLDGPEPAWAPGTWSTKMVDLATEAQTMVTDLMTALCTGVTVTTKLHDMKPAATMQIDADNTIKVNGVAVT